MTTFQQKYVAIETLEANENLFVLLLVREPINSTMLQTLFELIDVEDGKSRLHSLRSIINFLSGHEIG